jgi:3-hydroxyisobutyrate dehydrogenase-like beta-hydroxyacid dehydrogenase
MDVAVLGMGRMGQAVAKRLLGGGHSVVVWNRSKGKADDVLAAGGREAGSIADAVEGAEVVITSLSDDDAVRELALGEGGIRSAIGPDAVYADVSTISPLLGEALAAEFPRFVAMPILGAPSAVEAGEATYLVGGDPAVAERLGPLLATLSEKVRRYDTPRKALCGKLANNLMLLAEVAALAEAFAVGRSGGLSDDELRGLLGQSPMLPPGLRNRFDGVLTGQQEPWWATALGAKDAALAVDAAAAAGVDLPLGEAVRELYRAAAVTSAEDDDIIVVAARYRPNPPR